MKYCYGVDLGGTAIKFGLFDEAGELREKWQLPTKIEDSGKHILSDIGTIFQRIRSWASA